MQAIIQLSAMNNQMNINEVLNCQNNLSNYSQKDQPLMIKTTTHLHQGVLVLPEGRDCGSSDTALQALLTLHCQNKKCHMHLLLFSTTMGFKFRVEELESAFSESFWIAQIGLAKIFQL